MKSHEAEKDISRDWSLQNTIAKDILWRRPIMIGDGESQLEICESYSLV